MEKSFKESKEYIRITEEKIKNKTAKLEIKDLVPLLLLIHSEVSAIKYLLNEIANDSMYRIEPKDSEGNKITPLEYLNLKRDMDFIGMCNDIFNKD